MDDSTRTKKSRHGCGSCRKKRMKCDEGKPTCQNCAYRKVECPGYARDLKWSTKYERFKPSKQKPAPRRPASPLQSQFQQVRRAIGGPTVIEVAQTPAATASQATSKRLDRNVAIRFAKSPEGDDDHFSAADFRPRDEQTMDVNGPRSSSDTIESNVREQADEFDFVAAHDEGTICVDNDSGSDARPEPMPHVDESDKEHIHDEEAMLGNAETGLIPSSGSTFSQDWTRVFSPTIGLRYEDESSERLVYHYFDSACRIMSCYDSRTNPYRTTIPDLQRSSAHIRACMMGMSASHMANFVSGMAVTAMRYQTEAVKELASQLPVQSLHRRSSIGPASTFEMLLGTIMLGMTSAWYDATANATANGFHHLRGARSLFRTWAAEQAIIDANGAATVLDRQQSFVVGSMAYWECLSSFIADQSLDTIAYLTPFTETMEGQMIYPNPWTGISTPIFIRMAQAGVLLRQKRILDKLSCIRRGSYVGEMLAEELQEEARGVLSAVMSYTLPPEEIMEETGDANTPLQHLCDVAIVYRLTAILELYQTFPTLAVRSIDPTDDDYNIPLDESAVNDTIFDLASSITSIISALPRESGTYTVLCMALICAGGAMQSQHAQHSDVPDSLEGELARIRRSRSALAELRATLKEQILHTRRQLGLAAVQRAAKLVQQVWNECDVRAEVRGDLGKQRIHWMDVMMELRLETLFG